MNEEMLSYLCPSNVLNHNLVRIGKNADGGYVMLNHNLTDAIAYSLGIGREISWDNEMVIKNNCLVYQYDHTVNINELPLIKGMIFHKIGICAEPSSTGSIETLENVLRLNNHIDKNNLILKMDIEGSEWNIFNTISTEILNKFSQIVVEFHDIFTNTETKITALKHIRQTHVPIHVHGNNHGPAKQVNGMLVPETIEVTYVRTDDYQFVECVDDFPRAIDKPNHPNYADFIMGKIGILWKNKS